jgi:hypothetical protein
MAACSGRSNMSSEEDPPRPRKRSELLKILGTLAIVAGVLIIVGLSAYVFVVVLLG